MQNDAYVDAQLTCGHSFTLVNVYVDLLVHVFTRIAGTS